jgi:hypothetical protein
LTSKDDQPKIPTTPRGLAAGGRAKWRECHQKYLFTPSETAILARICLKIDVLARLDAELAASTVVVAGSRGQPVPSPLLSEMRLQEAILAKLCKQLNLPDDTSRVAPRKSRRRSRLASVQHMTGGSA